MASLPEDEDEAVRASDAGLNDTRAGTIRLLTASIEFTGSVSDLVERRIGLFADSRVMTSGLPILTEMTFVAHAFTSESISCYLYAPHPTITSSILFKYVVFVAIFSVT